MLGVLMEDEENIYFSELSLDLAKIHGKGIVFNKNEKILY
jgi:hypothetical protein